MTDSIELRVVADAGAVAAEGAEEIARCIQSSPRSVLGLATGRTPVAVYARLRAMQAARRISFAGVTTFNLDEYGGLPPDHPASYHRYMRRELFDHVNIAPGAWHVPDGMTAPGPASAAYETTIRNAGGIDLQLLGIGENGHIGFNEPGSPFDSRTREVTLAPSTREANAAEFPAGEAPPETAITMGIGTILEARRILLLATGPRKAAALAAALCGPVGPEMPASALRLHPAVTIIADRAAAAGLDG